MTGERPGGITTTGSPVGRWALVCKTCKEVLSVAEPVDFDGAWQYPHPDHDTHQLATLNPAGEIVIQDAPAARTARTVPGVMRAKHGTESGYQAHRRLATPPCDACRLAHSAAARERARRTGRSTRDARTGRGLHVCETCDWSHDTMSALARHVWTAHDRPPRKSERTARPLEAAS